MASESLIPLMRKGLTSVERKLETFKFVAILLHETYVSSAPFQCEAEGGENFRPGSTDVPNE